MPVPPGSRSAATGLGSVRAATLDTLARVRARAWERGGEGGEATWVGSEQGTGTNRPPKGEKREGNMSLIHP